MLLCMAAAGLIGYFGAEMLLRKRLQVFDRSWAGFGVLCALVCLLVLGRYSEAEKYIMSAMAEDPELEDTRYYLGICAMSLEDNEKAVKLFTESVERGESVTPSLYDRAVCRLNTGDISGAVSDLREVIARNDEPDLTQQARDLLDSIL